MNTGILEEMVDNPAVVKSKEKDLAKAKQNDQGNYECEVWTTVAEGAKEWEKCQKYPGHKQFIPVREFSLQNLPEQFQDDDVFEYVRFMCERTVRLLVKYTSTERPDDYPFSNFRGQYINHTGTGLLYCYEYPESFDNENEYDARVGDEDEDERETAENVNDYSEKSEGFTDSDDESSDDFKIYEYFDLKAQPCPCKECSRSDTTHYQWGYFIILTAKHVVYDKQEAENTIAEVNFDDQQNKQNVKRLYVVDINHVDLNKADWTILKCVTHDRELYIQLYDTAKRVSELRDIIHEKYWESPSRLTLVVSHPHGWMKHVTVGEWIERRVKETNLDEDELVQYTYNTPTCRGSSGAPVLVLGMRGSDPSFKTWLSQHHVHNGSEGIGSNFSGIEEERRINFDNIDDDGDDDEAKLQANDE